MIQALALQLSRETEQIPDYDVGMLRTQAVPGAPERATVTLLESREIIATVPEYLVAPEHQHKAVGRFHEPTGHNLPAGQSGWATFLRMPTGRFRDVRVQREGCAYSPLYLKHESGVEEIRVWVCFDHEGALQDDAPGRLVSVPRPHYISDFRRKG